MSVARIAKRYAQPLLELAVEQKVLEAVKADMVGFSELCKENKDFNAMLKSPVIPHLKKGEILKQIFSKKANSLTVKFFDVITRKNREAYLPEVAKSFVSLYNDHMGMQEATVTTTVKLDKDTLAVLEKMVKDMTGKTPILTEKINKELVGGYILQLGDQRLDESISGQLNDLKLKFQKETI